ncbi:hypothetical protein [Mumia zhuanghuii]|uniref:Uncharacterized protein n=1 Tax=Mumia zhuanghuii TaxID=2585211 RepID=A0A5C4M418_9ACTN|nr:hypothetical protein [Mumia zhuanghuii]TNC26839.1 hypothetical protein FHE65_34425 [Mumia zhuanghuii]
MPELRRYPDERLRWHGLPMSTDGFPYLQRMERFSWSLEQTQRLWWRRLTRFRGLQLHWQVRWALLPWAQQLPC